MPYYQEYFANTGQMSKYGSALRPIILDQCLMTSFRTAPHPSSLGFLEKTDMSVDPYAYFLTSVDRKRYAEALAARGMKAPVGRNKRVRRPDHGHPFELLRHTIIGPQFDLTLGPNTWENAIFTYDGSGLDSIHNGRVTKIPSFGADELGTFSRQAYSRVAPTSVIFDAANFLGELRERLPNLAIDSLKDSSRFFRGLGSDFLNVEFGWKPFLADLLRAGDALRKATLQLSQNGQRVHRRYGVPTKETQLSTTSFGQFDVGMRAGMGAPVGLIPTGFPAPSQVLGQPWPYNQSIGSAPYNKKFASKRVTVDRWFEGEFSSFFPLDFDPTDYFSRLDQLVNTKVTPEVLWNLTPWSWLVDWNLRIGDNLRANELRANDLLIMHYGYGMERTVYTTTLTASQPTNTPGYTYPQSVSSIFRTTRKRRIRANPYGFGIGGASALTPEQLAILAALGLTKSGN